jgi:hypothetical protein
MVDCVDALWCPLAAVCPRPSVAPTSWLTQHNKVGRRSTQQSDNETPVSRHNGIKSSTTKMPRHSCLLPLTRPFDLFLV